jgi:hypothetical protein
MRFHFSLSACILGPTPKRRGSVRNVVGDELSMLSQRQFERHSGTSHLDWRLHSGVSDRVRSGNRRFRTACDFLLPFVTWQRPASLSHPFSLPVLIWLHYLSPP